MIQNSGNFAAILLQDDAVRHLQRSFERGRIAQTYLFCGNESSGRMPLALAFSALLQCQAPVADANGLLDACGLCESCCRIVSGSHPDVNIVKPDGYEIRIDQVRQLQDRAMLKPMAGRWQIFILDPADRLNVSSANCLLKILEEAPEHVVFLLLARGTEAVLPTILSRSEIVRLAVPSHQQARQVLIDHAGLSFDAAAVCYAASEGRFGQALLLSRESFAADGVQGIRHSHSQYLNTIELHGSGLYEEFSSCASMDEALRLAGGLGEQRHVPLQLARKNFCRSLVMNSGLPAAFALMFSDELLSRLDHVSGSLKKSVDILLADAKRGYSSSMYKEIEGQFNSAFNQWASYQLEQFFACLLNWYGDALSYASCEDETLLLNLDRKQDIITLAEVDGIVLIRARIELLQRSVGLLRRHVQPQLIIENVITQIGGTEA